MRSHAIASEKEANELRWSIGFWGFIVSAGCIFFFLYTAWARLVFPSEERSTATVLVFLPENCFVLDFPPNFPGVKIDDTDLKSLKDRKSLITFVFLSKSPGVSKDSRLAVSYLAFFPDKEVRKAEVRIDPEKSYWSGKFLPSSSHLDEKSASLRVDFDFKPNGFLALMSLIAAVLLLFVYFSIFQRFTPKVEKMIVKLIDFVQAWLQ